MASSSKEETKISLKGFIAEVLNVISYTRKVRCLLIWIFLFIIRESVARDYRKAANNDPSTISGALAIPTSSL